jgi:hypothetical protein
MLYGQKLKIFKYMLLFHLRKSELTRMAVLFYLLFAFSTSAYPYQQVSVSTSTSVDGKVYSYKSVNNFTEFNYKYQGVITVTPDDKDVKSISPGGFLRIESTTFGNTRVLHLEGDSDGKIRREYYEGKTRVDYEPEGKKWLADVLIDVVRSSGIDAEARTVRIYKSRGTTGVLDEIEEIPSNRAKGLYFRLLLNQAGVTNGDLKLIIASVGEELSSNTEMGSLLREIAPKYLANEDLSTAYFRTVQSLSSNTEAGSVLRNAIKRGTLSDRSQIELLRTTQMLSSNTERGSVLRAFNPISKNSEEVNRAYFDAINSMSSNTEIGATLVDLIRNQKISGPSLNKLFNSAALMSSETEKGRVLREAIKLMPGTIGSQESFFHAAQSMSSNTELGLTLTEYLKYAFSNGSKAQFFSTARHLSSNTELGNVLRRCSDYVKDDEAGAMEFLKTALHLSSNTELGSVLRTLTEKTTNPKILEAIIKASEQLSSNTEKGSVLVTVAGVMPKNNETLRTAYKNAAKTLSSDSEYRRVMDMIY